MFAIIIVSETAHSKALYDRQERFIQMAYAVRKTYISKARHPEMYGYLDSYSRKSKLLQNAALFRLRNWFTAHGKQSLTVNELSVVGEIDAAVSAGMGRPKAVLSYFALDRVMRVNHNPDFFAGLPMQSAQECLKQKCREFRSWLNALKEYKADPSKLPGRPKMPGYIKSDTAIVRFTNQDCVLYGDTMKFPHTKETISFGRLPEGCILKEVQSVPCHGQYLLIAVLETPDTDAVSDMPYKAAIDFGVDNFASIAPDTDIPCLICKGGAMKAENQWFNKRMAELKAVLMKGHDPWAYHPASTKQMEALSLKREQFFHDYFHKLSKYIVRWCLENRIGTLVYGHTKLWKQKTSIGKQNTQNFVQLPFMAFVSMLRYQCGREGIRLLEQEESYTSKASAVDGDLIPVYGQEHEKPYHFSGTRVKHGLYRTGDGRTVNADLNGAANILRKAFPDAYECTDVYAILRNIQTIRFGTLYKVSG